MNRKILIVFLVACFSVTGCETLKGLAKDMANTGNNIQDVVRGGPEFE